MNLETRLNKLVKSNPDIYTDDSVERVREFIRHIEENPESPRPFGRMLTDIADFEMFYNTHPEIRGKTAKELQDGTPGGNSFYQSLLRFCRKETGDDPVEGERLRAWIPRSLNTRTDHTTLEHYKREYEADPNLKGKTAKELLDDLDNGGNSFYQSLRKFCKIQTKGEKGKVREMMGWLPKKRNYSRSKYTTIKQFRQEYENNPHFRGKTRGELSEDVRFGGSSFHQMLIKFCNKNTGGDKKKRDKLLSWIPAKRKDRSSYTSMDDFREEYNSTPAFKGKTRNQLNKDRENGGKSFYSALMRYCRINSGGDKNRQVEMMSWLPSDKRNRSGYAMDDFRQEYAGDPNLKGKTQNELYLDRNRGGESFMRALIRFCKKESKGDKKKEEQLRQWVPKNNNDWSDFTTVGHFKREYETNPHFKGKSASELYTDDKHGGARFYGKLIKFCRTKAKGDMNLQRKMTNWLPKDRYEWDTLTSINDFIEEYNNNPELAGRSRTDMMNDYGNIGAAFYAALRRFCDIETGGDKKKTKEMIKWIPYSDRFCHYDFGKGPIRFDSRPERTIAILLNKYGLLRSPEEDVNIHVPTNGKRKHSIDFLVGNTFIEYHPLHFSDIRAGLDFDDVFQKRWENITNPAYSEHWLWMIDKVSTLYDVLKDPEVNPLMYKKYQMMSKKEFSEDVRWARKATKKYDAAHPPKKRPLRKAA